MAKETTYRTRVLEIITAIAVIFGLIGSVSGLYSSKVLAEHDGEPVVHLVAANRHDKDPDAHLIMQKKLIKEIVDDLANSIASKVVDKLEQREEPTDG